MNKVCVLMAAYNGSLYIEEQIATILDQQGLDVDLYIRLDPSFDDTEKIVNQIVDSRDNVYLLSLDEPSGSAGQNFFRLVLEVDFSAYDYIAFADQDDIWFLDKLERAVDCIISHNVSAYSANVIAWWEDGVEKLVNKASPQRQYDYLFESAGPGCTFVLKTELAIELKKYLISLGDDISQLWLHDWLCYAFARSRDYDWYIDATPKMKYRQHSFNSVGANSGFSAFKTRVKEVTTGRAIEKVLTQAKLLKIEGKKPIRLLMKDDFSSMIALAFMALKCRRKFTDQIIFLVVVFAHFLKR